VVHGAQQLSLFHGHHDERCFLPIHSPMDTTTPAGRAFLQIQAAFAEMERNLIRQRVNEGLTAARARGRQGGRPRVVTPERLRFAQHLMADKTRTIPQISGSWATSRQARSITTSMQTGR
jgi:DNA invertase Pin-like site-specific DNA recombinase